jgi:pimeloyl-ACP methyl ester carboxylesterase
VVALVHGMDDRWTSWSALAEHLPGAWRLVAFDMPWSTAAEHMWRREATAGEWVKRALAGIGPPVSAVAGHSFGANALLEALASPSPPDCPRSALIAPFYRPPQMPVTWELFDACRRSLDRTLSGALRLRLGERAARIEEGVLEHMLSKRWSDRNGPLAFLTVFEQFVNTGYLALDDVPGETLVLGGSRDPSLSHGRGEFLAAQLPRGRAVLRKEYAHFCHTEQVAGVARDLVAFMAPLTPEGAAGTVQP